MDANGIYGILTSKIRKIQISGGGITSYRDLTDKPVVNQRELNGQLSLEDLGIAEISNIELEELIKNIGGL